MRKGTLKYVLISLVCAVCLCGCINKVDGDYHPQIRMNIDGKEYLLNTKGNLGDIFYLRKESFSLYINNSYTIAPDAFTFKFMISAEGEPEIGRKYTLPTVETEKAWESFVVLSRWGIRYTRRQCLWVLVSMALRAVAVVGLERAMRIW